MGKAIIAPTERPTDHGSFDPGEVQRFVEFAERRLGVKAPDWSRSTLMRSTADGPGLTGFPIPEPDHYQETAYRYTAGSSTSFALFAAADTSVEVRQGRAVVSTDRGKVRVSDENVREKVDGLGPAAGVTALPAPERCLLAVHNAEVGVEYPLLCVDAKTGAVLWEARVWAAGRESGGSGGNIFRFCANYWFEPARYAGR